MTVPLSFKGVVDHKFIRFANQYPNEIKILLVIYDNDDEVPFVKDAKTEHIIYLNIDEVNQQKIDEINELINTVHLECINNKQDN